MYRYDTIIHIDICGNICLHTYIHAQYTHLIFRLLPPLHDFACAFCCHFRRQRGADWAAMVETERRRSGEVPGEARRRSATAEGCRRRSPRRVEGVEGVGISRVSKTKILLSQLERQKVPLKMMKYHWDGILDADEMVLECIGWYIRWDFRDGIGCRLDDVRWYYWAVQRQS